jgi:lipopolysaccharide biosynthesis regulator YciM
LLWATNALAQAKDTEAAKRHYLAGKDALAKKDTDRAVREFVQAYDLSKDPTMFKQIGAAYESGGRNMEAAI